MVEKWRPREVQESHQVEWDGRKRQQGPEWMEDTIQLPGHTIAWHQCARGRILKMILGQSPGSPQIPTNLFMYMEVRAIFIFDDGLVINSSTCGKFQDAGEFKSEVSSGCSLSHWERDGFGSSCSVRVSPWAVVYKGIRVD